MRHPHDLVSALTNLRHLRLRRGRGAQALEALRRRLAAGEVAIDETTEAQLTELIASLTYAVQDAEREAQQNLRLTSRTIGAAIRRGGQ